jgi:hypothetical protein
MEAYLPRDPMVLVWLGLLALAIVLDGPWIARKWWPSAARVVAWLALAGVVPFVERIFEQEPAGLRMLALILIAMMSLKVVVLVHDRRDPPLSFGRWLGFALGWPGMRPHLFAQARTGALSGVSELLAKGFLYFAAGILLLLVSRWVWSATHSEWLATALFFLGSSFFVHFGVFDLLAAAWRARGVACDELFRAPWKAQSLSEFWSKRWNLAFSEMTSIAIYRPLSRSIGRNGAMLAAFIVSGLLHEMAISLPVKSGYGLPTAYFALHGGLVWIERERARRGQPVRGTLGRIWTLGTLIIPLPILFHRPFLEGIVWPLIGIR